MTYPLLTSSQLQSIQKLGERGMQTDVTIRNRLDFATDPSNPNGDETVSYGTAFTVKGWLRPVINYELDVRGAQLVTPGEFVLRVPVGTEIHAGDEAAIGGDTYTVIDSNNEATWPEWIDVRLTRAQ